MCRALQPVNCHRLPCPTKSLTTVKQASSTVYESWRGCRSNGETTFEQDIIKKSRCEVHVFDPTLDEAVAAQVKAIKGVTFHPYGLGAVDGVVRLPFSVLSCIICRCMSCMAAQMTAAKGMTFHPYGLGAIDVMVKGPVLHGEP